MQILKYEFKIKTFKDKSQSADFFLLQISTCVMYYFSEAWVNDYNMRCMHYIIPQNTLLLLAKLILRKTFFLKNGLLWITNMIYPGAIEIRKPCKKCAHRCNKEYFNIKMCFILNAHYYDNNKMYMLLMGVAVLRS